MKKKEYSEQEIVTVRFDSSLVKEFNRIALMNDVSRNAIINRLTKIALDEVSKGRRIFAG
jgi:metal-responsive CopG/Arc/MetJ family transcriptional regulator